MQTAFVIALSTTSGLSRLVSVHLDRPDAERALVRLRNRQTELRALALKLAEESCASITTQADIERVEAEQDADPDGITRLERDFLERHGVDDAEERSWLLSAACAGPMPHPVVVEVPRSATSTVAT